MWNKQGLVQREKTDEEERYEQQRMEYELRFMSERERRSTMRQHDKDNDRQYQRRLKFLARKDAEAAEALAAGNPLPEGSATEDANDGSGSGLDEWSTEAQPTDLASQQRVLVTFYKVPLPPPLPSSHRARPLPRAQFIHPPRCHDHARSPPHEGDSAAGG
eukprot:COSAG06_NODE_2507_length_6747_cov_38.233604_4_plen_161_part_00